MFRVGQTVLIAAETYDMRPESTLVPTKILQIMQVPGDGRKRHIVEPISTFVKYTWRHDYEMLPGPSQRVL